MIQRLLRRRETIPALLVILAFVGGIIETPLFLKGGYLLDESSLYVETGLLALGMTLVIVCGQIDLSVASTMALVACCVAKLLQSGWSTPTSLLAGLILGTLLGVFNGVLVARLRLPSFVVTLATLAGYRGIAQAMLGAQSIKIPANLVGIDYLKLPGTPVPVPLSILILVAIVFGLLLHRTVLGRWIYAVGSNERASIYSGVPAASVKVVVFALSGLLAGAAGLVIDSRLGVARYDHARGLELDAITTVVLGGAAIAGGEGTVLCSMLALMLIAMLRIEMGLANVSAEYQLAAIGALLILAVLFGNLRHLKSRRPARST